MLRKALQYQRLCGGVIALHEEDPTLSRGGVDARGRRQRGARHRRHPHASRESTMVARDAALAGYEDARVHFQHLSCAASVRRRRATPRRAAARVSAEVSPHHLLLTDEDVRGLDTRMKMHPPLATEEDRQALIEGLRDGTIDCVATDHAPARARREGGARSSRRRWAPPGLETAFAALYTGLVLPGRARRSALLVERMTAGAALFELPTPRDRVGRARQPHARRPRRRVDRRRARLGEPLGELLLRRAAPARARAADARRRRGRPPRARRSRWRARDEPARPRARGAASSSTCRRAFAPTTRFAAVARACAKLAAGRAHPRAAGARQRAVPEGPRPHRAGGRASSDEPRIEKTVFSAARADGFDLGGRDAGDRVRDRDARVRQPDRPRPARRGRRGARARRRRRLAPRARLRARPRAHGARRARSSRRVEAALFELLERAGTPEFKAVQKLII